MTFSRRPGARLNRGRVATGGGDGQNLGLNAPTIAIEDGDGETHVATEGDELTVLVTVDDGDGATTSDVELYLNGVLVDSMTDDGGGAWSYALADVLPGSHSYRVKRITDLGFRWSATWLVTVDAEVPSLDAPLDEDVITIGDPVTFEATGTVDGFDANTSKVEFYVESVLRATANTDTAGVWTEDWDTTGATPAVGQAVVARRYWLGVSGQSGTADSVDDVAIDLDEGGDVVAPTLVSAVIDAAGTTLTLTYDEALDETSEPALATTSIAGAALSALTGTPNVSGSTVTYSITPAVCVDESGITVTYTAGASPIQDLAGNDAANLVDQAVTNNSTHVFASSDISSWIGDFDMQDAASFTLNVGETGITEILNRVSSQAYDTPVNDTPYEATGLNGHPCLHPLVTGDRAQAAEAALYNPFQNTPTAITLAAYLSFDAADAGLKYHFAASASASNNGSHSFGQSNTGNGRYIYRTVDDAAASIACESSDSSNPSTSGHTSIWTLAAGSASHYKDNATADPSGFSIAPVTLTVARIGLFAKADSTPDSPAAARIGKISVYSKVLSTAERTRWHDRISAAWA